MAQLEPDPAWPGVVAITVSLMERTENKIWLSLLVVMGIVVGLAVFPDDWSLSRQIAGGALLGVGSMMSVFMPRMIGGSDFN